MSPEAVFGDCLPMENWQLHDKLRDKVDRFCRWSDKGLSFMSAQKSRAYKSALVAVQRRHLHLPLSTTDRERRRRYFGKFIIIVIFMLFVVLDHELNTDLILLFNLFFFLYGGPLQKNLSFRRFKWNDDDLWQDFWLSEFWRTSDKTPHFPDGGHSVILHWEKCCHLVSKQEAFAGAYAPASASSWWITQSLYHACRP